MEITIKPTYLYIKQHSITGFKYFGKTVRDPYVYMGSGKRWKSHIKTHGKEHVITCLVFGSYLDKITIQEDALFFSEKLDIVNSKEWANLKQEDGLNGGNWTFHSEEALQKIREARKKQKSYWRGKERSDDTKQKIREARLGVSTITEQGRQKIIETLTGRPVSTETRNKMSIIKSGIIVDPHTAEHNQKISNTMIGIIRSNETKQKMSTAKKNRPKVECPHCNKVGEIANMTRWHFDNCRLLLPSVRG